MGATKLMTAAGGGITLDAASTATDKTITVPADNGTLVYANSSGNVGIGTAPSAWTTFAPVLQIKTGTGAGALTGTSVDNFRMFSNTYYDGAYKRVGAGYATQYEQAAGAHVWYTAGTSTANSSISFTQAMTLDSSGNLLVGTTSGSNRLTVSSSANDYIARLYNTNGTGADMLYMQSSTDPNNSTYKTIYTVNNATARFYVQSNGGIGNYSANNVNLSDSREKTNANPAGNYLAKICAIPVRTYNYIDQNLEEDDGLTLGVFAQDVQAVAPELVTESNWGTEEEPKMRLSIYQTDMQYALMKCIQELKAELDAAKADIAALKGTV